MAIASTGPGGGTRGLASVPGGPTAAVSTVETGDGFFDVTGLPIVRGRAVRPDETGGAALAIVSEAAAGALFPGQDPLGKEMDVGVRGQSTRVLVVGIAREAKRMAVPVRVHMHADTMREIAGGRNTLRLFGAFALIALLLAGSGIFAVVSQSVAQRTPEFGVRLALGATPWRVLRAVLVRELRLIAAALATGTIGTFAMTRSSGFDDAAMVVAVNMSRPAWGIGLIGLCGVVAVGACLLATSRIVKLDPSAILRRL